MNRTNSGHELPSKAAEDRRTPRRWRVGHSRVQFRQVLECAGPAALWIARTGSSSECTAKLVLALHETERGQPCPRSCSATFMVPMHSKKTKGVPFMNRWKPRQAAARSAGA